MLDLLIDELEDKNIDLESVTAIGYQRGGGCFYLRDGSEMQYWLSQNDFDVIKKALAVLDQMRREQTARRYR